MTQKIPALQLYYDHDFVARVPLTGPKYRIGRKSGSNLRLLDAQVSREHCRLIVEQGGIFVEDASSTNGTFVNKTRIIRTQIKPKDVIGLGRCSLVYSELAPIELLRKQGGLGKFLKLKTKARLTAPIGAYVFLDQDTVTEFDGVAWAMVRHSSEIDESKLSSSTYVRDLPRVQVIARKDNADEDVTKFTVSDSVFKGIDTLSLAPPKKTDVVFTQPAVKARGFKIPWRTLEFLAIPVILLFIGIGLTRYFLSFHIESELEKAEKHWSARLTQVEQKYQYAEDTDFETAPSPATTTTTRVAKHRRSAPLSVAEVWKRIDMQPGLRDFLLFEILDEVLESEKNWSLDSALKNLSKIQSVTSRLPSVKKLQVVLNMEAAPFDMKGLVESRVLFLSDQASAATSYAEYKSEMTPRLAVVSSCSEVRQSISPGKVVLAFTVGRKGKISSVFINKSRSSKEQALWTCVDQKLRGLDLGPPPGGSLSIVYTFAFAGSQKVTF
jgi:hypothetical protein